MVVSQCTVMGNFLWLSYRFVSISFSSFSDKMGELTIVGFCERKMAILANSFFDHNHYYLGSLLADEQSPVCFPDLKSPANKRSVMGRSGGRINAKGIPSTKTGGQMRKMARISTHRHFIFGSPPAENFPQASV